MIFVIVIGFRGRRRNATDWTYNNVPTTFLFDRGYTGHEHLDIFSLINMNGRVYDPWLGRFLSPDNFVQAAGYSQNYNRYTYALNNPLKYTDPDGEFWNIIIGAAIGGVVNVALHWNQIHNFKDGAIAFGIGAAAGAIGGATFGAAFIAGGGAGFFAGALAGAATSTVTMPIQNIGNHFYFGDPLMSAKEYAFGIGTGALLGGVLSGVPSALEGKNFWTGAPKATGRSAFSFNNTTKQVAGIEKLETRSLSNINLNSDNKIQEMAQRMKPGLKEPASYQEIRVSIEEGNFKLDFRVETHNRVDNVFKELNLNKSDYVRHANIQLYQKIENQWVNIQVPGTQTENYHIFLELMNKYNQ